MSDLIHARIVADRHSLGTEHAAELADLIASIRPDQATGALDGRGVILGPGGVVVARTTRIRSAAYVDEDDARRLGLRKREVGMVLASLGEGHVHESMRGLLTLTRAEHERKTAEVAEGRAPLAEATDAAHAAMVEAQAVYEAAQEARRDAIRAEVAAGASRYSIAKRLGVSPQAVERIVR